MPKAFEDSIKQGAKVRRVSGPNKKFGLTKNQFVNIAFLEGKSFVGEKKIKQIKKPN